MEAELMSVSGKFSRFVLLAVAFLTAFLVFAVPQACEEALRAGLALCTGPLLLSLFPFLIVSSLLIQCDAGGLLGVFLRPAARLIGLRSSCAEGVLLVGMLGGFAPAANAVAEGVRRGRLSADEASALLPACVCSGPSFVVLTVGGRLLGSAAVGVRLFLAQLLAGWLAAALLNRASGRAKRKARAAAGEGTNEPIPGLDVTIANSALTYLKLCGFVIYFRMLASGAAEFLPRKYAALPAMLLEVSSGCALASQAGLWASALCCAALSLQGASVLMQVRTICPKEISLAPLLAARIVHLPLSLALFYVSLPEKAQEAFAAIGGRVITMRRVPADCALLVFFACCLAASELCGAMQRLNLKLMGADERARFDTKKS